VETADCILCRKPGAPGFEKADKFPPHERFRVVRCPECGLAWVSPRPGPQDIGRYYPDTYSWRPGSQGAEPAVHRLERWYRFHLLRYETRQLLANTDLARGDAVLDVGCSSGDRLLVMKEAGLVPAGVEISPAADFARERLGLDVRRGEFFCVCRAGGWAGGRDCAAARGSSWRRLSAPRASGAARYALTRVHGSPATSASLQA